MEADREFIEKYLEKYTETQGVLPEKLEEYGKKYRQQGHLTREQLYEIAYESSTRSAYHVEKNPEERCEKVTANALELEDGFSKIALISALKGFKAPTASCVVAAEDPENHAVVDTRVWASLERLGKLDGRKETFDADDYAEMIEPIREIAGETGYTAAEVGYALFAHNVEKREGTLH
jgi:thermostable 8-oxoguanine DNA glycosylase